MLAALVALPGRVLAALTVLVTAALAGLVVVFVLTPAAQRPDIWKAGGLILGGLGITAPAIGAWLKARVVHTKVQAVETTVAKIDSQTNGVLDRRISTQVRAALADLARDAEGFIAATRTAEGIATVPIPTTPTRETPTVVAVAPPVPTQAGAPQ